MDSSEPYRALRQGAGLIDRSARGRLIVAGADRRAYLQGLLTNDILALTAGAGCYAAYLTPQGRMISDMRVFETGEEILMDLEGHVTARVRDRLSEFIFSEDVAIKDQTERTVELGVYGPRAASSVAAVLGVAALSSLEAMPLYSIARAHHDAYPVHIVRSDDAGVAGFDLVFDADARPAIEQRLLGAGAVPVDAATAETCRIEGGRPRFGADMDEDTIPLEAGIDARAISLTKGCYVGQEIVIRVLHRGGGRVARRLVGLTFHSSAPVPAAGQPIHGGDREIGRITSATRSPSLERPIALGYVHRDFVAPGTQVSVAAQAANVAELPFAFS